MTTVDASVQAPSGEDGFVAGASEFIGGPLGRHAVRPGNRWAMVSAVVIALTCFMLFFSMLATLAFRRYRATM